MNKKVLITGASRGIGLELTTQYLKTGWTVFALIRKDNSALKKLESSFSETFSLFKGDVTEEKTWTLLKNNLSQKTNSIDLLINNAGIWGGHDQDLNTVQPDIMMKTFLTNSVAPLMMTKALLPLLSEGSLICHITSRMGSITDNTSGGRYAYRAAKAALNMINKSLSVDLHPKRICSVVMHPGWVKTDMGGPNALITVKESAEGIRHLLSNVTLEESGQFFNYQGEKLHW